MLKIKIPFEVSCQNLTAVKSENKLRAGNRNYFYIAVTPTDEWLTVDSTYAIFKRGDLVIKRDLVTIDNIFECQIPNEMMTTKGIFTVGIGGGDTLVTNEVYVWVETGCGYVCEGGEGDVTPDAPSDTSAILGNAKIGLLVLGNGG